MYRFYREIKCVTERKKKPTSELFHRPFFSINKEKKKGSEVAIHEFISSCNCK